MSSGGIAWGTFSRGVLDLASGSYGATNSSAFSATHDVAAHMSFTVFSFGSVSPPPASAPLQAAFQLPSVFGQHLDSAYDKLMLGCTATGPRSLDGLGLPQEF